jgi:hypothetical protein
MLNIEIRAQNGALSATLGTLVLLPDPLSVEFSAGSIIDLLWRKF